MTAFPIVPAEEKHLAAIMELETVCFGNDAWAEETMAFELLAEHTRYFVVLDGEKIRGFAGL